MNPTLLKAPRTVWLFALIVSVGLLAVVIQFADLEIITLFVDQISWALVTVGVVALMLEGIFSAVRIKLLCTATPAFRDCLTVTAWWVLWLAILPARLGELAGVHMLRRRLGQSLGGGLSNLVIQRLLDVAVLLLAGVSALLLQVQPLDYGQTLAIGIIGAGALLLVTWNLMTVLGLLARGLYPWRRFPRGRTILRTLRQARGVGRRVSTPGTLAGIAVVSVLKWCANLGGLTVLMFALMPESALLERVSVAVFYNLAAVIPLQTLGGIGIGEASIIAGLVWYGRDAEMAASAALLLRLALTGAPLLFWVFVVPLGHLLGLDDHTGRKGR